MKNIASSLLILTAFFSYSTVLVVDNNANAPGGVFTSFADGQAAAAAGDTLLLIPSTATYGNISIAQNLTVLGIGFNPDMDIPVTSTVGNVTIQTSASGAKLIGLVTGTITLGSTAGNLLNVVIENSRIAHLNASGSLTGLTNVLIRQNIFEHSSFTFQMTLNTPNQANIVVSNNIFSRPSATTSFSGIQVTTGGVTFDHNVFLGGTSQRGFHSLTNCLVTNNIFVQIDPRAQSASAYTNVTFRNNLWTGAVASFEENITGTNLDFDNNLFGTPTFENLPLNTLTYQFDLNARLQAGVGQTAGTDGTDLGVYGGTSPFKDSGSVLPVVRRFELPANVEQGTDASANIEITGN